MRIRLGVDDRLLAVAAVFLTLCMVVGGCVVQPSGKAPAKPKPGAKATLENVAFDAFQKRDIVRADLIDAAIKDIQEDRLKYDGPCMERLAKIGAEASEATWKPAANSAQSVMAGDKWSKEKAIKVFEAIRDGSRRAGK